jgi:predicted histidine transporter YuiF (NhaC family)
MNPAEFLLLGLLLAGSLLSYAKYRAATAKTREAAERRRKGIENAQREMRHSVTEVCVICQLAVVPETDIFDEATQSWWHRACWRESVK